MKQSVRLVVCVTVLVILSASASGVASGASGHAPPASVTPVRGTTSAAVTPVTGCREITEPGHYRLANDVVNATRDRCIEIYASDVVFDGAGHRIDGVGDYLFDDYGTETSTKGIVAEDNRLTNVTVRDVEVTDYGYGIWLGETSDGRIENSTFRSNGIYGIYIGFEAHNNTIVDNRIVNIRNDLPDVTSQGIVMAHHANGNVVADNYIRDVGDWGIEISESERTWVENNTIVDADEHGITGEKVGNVVVDNVVRGSGSVGIKFVDASGVRIVGNEVSGGGVGISLAKSDDGVVRDNVVTGTSEVGIRFESGVSPEFGDMGSANVTVAGNTVTENGGIGVFLPDGNDEAAISGNVVRDNGDEGIRMVRNGGNVLVDNTIGGHRFGVVLVEAGGTVLRGNALGPHDERDVVSRRHSAPITVRDATLSDGTEVSFTGRNVEVVGADVGPERLPDGTHAASGYLRIWPDESGPSWIDVAVDFEAPSGGASVDLWLYSGGWTKVPDDRIDRSRPGFSTNLTGLDGEATLVVGATDDPTRPSGSSPKPTGTSTTTPGQPGFGAGLALVSLLLVGRLARRYRV